MSDESPEISQRYISTELQANPEAKILHFKPDSTGRDEFGNRAFSSPLSYIDRENRETKAAILVSPEGERFIKSHRGILKAIDTGLQEYSRMVEAGEIMHRKEDKPKITLGGNGELTLLQSGNQSRTFLLTDSEGNNYVVQTLLSRKATYTSYSQPYVNEMLQTQELEKALHEDLSAAEIDMPQFLFATGFVSCTKYFENGEPATNYNLSEKKVKSTLKIFKKARDFAEKKGREHNPLWENIDIDAFTNTLPGDNVLKVGSRLAWIDPLYHLND
jgi:hypothetical protein